MFYNVDDDVNVDDADDNVDMDDDDDGDDDDVVDVRACTVEIRACADEIHMNISQEPFCVEIYRNSSVRQSRDTRFVRPCAIENEWTCHKRHFVEIYRENGRGHLRGQHFVRACAVEMHMDMSQEAFCTEIYKENAKRPSIEHRALTVTVRTPQCGHTV